MILGTAGHIDHGKTALVRALTGVDTDRLPEEKRRGITIELGFAPLALDGVGTVGVVDVPGHEAFVRTMVAGATGIDLALVVVAADEGVMPQTREHLAILELLGVHRGAVAITKADLVDAEWRALVEEDVRAATHGALPDAPIVATSVETGEGIDALRAALAAVARAVPSRDGDDLFRMPVDRAFTIKGTGTVVTGTVWSGTLRRDENVRILGVNRVARVRGIQSHGSQVDAAAPGSRAAIALAGVDVADVPRGSVLVTDPLWQPTTIARAEVRLAPGADRVVRPRTWVRFHVGTSDVGARVVTKHRDAAPGEAFAARIVLDEPVVLRAGDRFVLRGSAPLNTIGGGVIVDPYAPRRARPWPVGESGAQRLGRLIDEAGSAGVEVSSLPVRLGLTPTAARALVAGSHDAVLAPGDHLVAREAIAAIEQGVVDAVRAHHAAHPLEAGLPIQAVRSGLRAPPEIVDLATANAVRARAIVNAGGSLSLPDWKPTPPPGQQAALDQLLASLTKAGSEPPSVVEASAQLGVDAEPLFRYLERRGDVVQVEQNRYYTHGALKELLARLRTAMQPGKEYSPADLRDVLGFSRKYLIPFLEYCDRAGYTARGPAGRLWRGT
jgi:selenocysteine-specific elongation factor